MTETQSEKSHPRCFGLTQKATRQPGVSSLERQKKRYPEPVIISGLDFYPSEQISSCKQNPSSSSTPAHSGIASPLEPAGREDRGGTVFLRDAK